MIALAIFITIIVVTGFIVLARNVYQRSVRLRNQLQLSRVFTNISHELLTPLTVLSASVERLREQEPKYGTDYALMEFNIDRMVRLLQQILETSKSEAGELKLLISQGDVMGYVSQTALSLEPLMARRRLQFTVQCTPKSMMGWVDPDKTDKIIYNLLSNAAKYTHAGGKVMLQAYTNRTYDHITIKVSDSGIGIPRDKMKHLFQRFYDGDYRRMKTMGTGLGLALTRDLVYLHNGTISCESTEGQGTVFTVKLPISKEAFRNEQIDEKNKMDLETPRSAILDMANLLPEPTAPLPDTADANNSNAYKLLLVEDNLDLLVLMQQLLGHRYRIMTARNGKEALEAIARNKPDLVVSDVMMPEMDGNELTRQLKDNPETKHLPIILLTAKTQEAERMESLQLGADDYITKPFRLGDLQIRIDNIIENRKRLQPEEPTTLVAPNPQQPEEKVLTPEEEFLQRATECVNAHLSDSDFDRDTFAQEMGASSSTLYNKLKALTGKNITSFIRDIRMQTAYRLAQTEAGIRVSDLAYRVGFSDPKYFATCFKKEFGIQPSEFIDSQHGSTKAPETSEAH